jgi:hypothetical protein
MAALGVASGEASAVWVNVVTAWCARVVRLMRV